MALTIIERNIQLDLYDHDLTPSKIKAIALDSKTRYVGAEIHNGGQTYDVGQNTGVTLTIIRPDKTGVQVTGSTFQYMVGDGETVYGAYAELTQTALAVSGTLLAQFMLTSGDQILRTEIFTINNGVALDATVSEWAGEYQGYNLDELVQNVNTVVGKVDAMEQDVSELKEDFTDIVNSAYVTDSASGSVAHFVDGANNIPMKSVKVNIEPLQSGSGDPSPSNVRAISGWDSVKVTRTGKNVFPSKGLTQTLNGITIHSNDDGSFTVNGTASANAQFDLTLNNELKLQSGQYTVGMFADKAVTFDNQHVWWFFYNNDAKADIVNCQSPSKTFTLNAVTATRFYLRIISGATVDNVTFYPMLVYGSDAPTEFEPYNGNTYDVSLASAGTVYGGTLDVVSGGLNVTHGYIASYSGQTLPSAWISDRDVYAEGTRPTTGAQVVYRLATPLTYQLSAQETKSLLGVNNVWSDAGDVEAEYRADTKLYIDKRLAEVVT